MIGICFVVLLSVVNCELFNLVVLIIIGILFLMYYVRLFLIIEGRVKLIIIFVLLLFKFDSVV